MSNEPKDAKEAPSILTPEQQELLSQMEAAVRARPPEEEREEASEKFSGPVGFDDEGRPFPLKPNP